MTTTTQETRQGNNAITLIGEVKEHNLKVNTSKKDGKESTYINGNMVIKTGEFSDITLEVFVGELSSKGNVKKEFTTLLEFINEDLKTGANVKESKDVTKVRIFGDGNFTPRFKEDIFKGKGSDEVKTKIKMDLGFGKVAVDNRITPDQYKATFDVEVYVRNIIEEEKEGETTGRAKIEGLLPIYGGSVIPLEIIAGVVEDEEGSFDFGEQVLNGVDIGSTINLWGAINYQAIVTKITKGGSLGRAKVEEKTEYINEFQAEGGDVTEDENKEFDGELIKKALLARDSAIEEKKNEPAKEDKGSNKGKGLGSGKTEGRTRPKF